MGGFFGGNDGPNAVPPPPPPVPPAAIPPSYAAAKPAGTNQANAAAAFGAKGGTMKTGGQGDLTKPPIAAPALTGTLG